MQHDLATIWKRVSEDDDTAWATLVSLFAPYVFSLARQHRLSRAEAEDCSQQVWISLYRSRKRIRDPEKLLAWIRKTTRRRALRFLEQKRAREAREQVHVAARPLTSKPIDVEGMEDQLLLEVALEQLQPRCRWLLHQLFFAHEKTSYEAIARALGLSINALGPLRARCLKRLGKILKNLGYEVD